MHLISTHDQLELSVACPGDAEHIAVHRAFDSAPVAELACHLRTGLLQGESGWNHALCGHEPSRPLAAHIDSDKRRFDPVRTRAPRNKQHDCGDDCEVNGDRSYRDPHSSSPCAGGFVMRPTRML